MEPQAYVQEITFSDGKTIKLNPSDIVVFVGPNNSGKSQALRDIELNFSNRANNTRVIIDQVCRTIGSNSEMIEWLRKRSFQQKVNSKRPENENFQGIGYSVYLNQISHTWENAPVNGFQNLTEVFCKRLAAEERLQAVNPPANINFLSSAPQHPIHFIYRDDKLEEEVSSYFKQAFGKDIVVHRNAGSEIPLYVGDRPKVPEGKDRVSAEYINAVEALDMLSAQGDGMKSFTGIILNVLLVKRSLTLLDEPEAFLHPPQAKLLGNMLANKTPDNQQLFIATHSSDILHGLMDAKTSRVRVIRIERNGNINIVNELSNSSIQKLWNDPLLRYSNILNGLFHEHVVLCESDADCRFYQAMADALYLTKGVKQPDVLFVHCGGKQRMPQILSALTCLDIPVSVIADFDIFREEEPLKSVIDNVKKDWAACENDWKKLKLGVDTYKRELRTSDVKREVERVMNHVSADIFPKDSVVEIQKILKRSSPWSNLKGSGCSGLPAGDCTTAYNKLNAELESMGIFVVPVGELEGFDKSIGNHGPRWANEVLEKRNLLTSLELQAARNFVQKIYDTISV